jgi:hypothetical protein
MNKIIKIVFYVVLAVNVLFFAVMKLDLFGDGQPVPIQPPLNAEKIVLQVESASLAVPPAPVQSAAVSAPAVASAPPAVVAQSAPVKAALVKPEPAKPEPVKPVLVKPEPVKPEPVVVAKPAKPACYEWGEFSGDELEQVSAALRRLQLGNKLVQHDVLHTIGYWVYIAPHKDKSVVNQRVARLKEQGVTDLFVIQEPGEWLNAIQLGVFKSHESAQNFLEGLRAKEVTTAQIGERASKIKSKRFVINNVDEVMSAKLSSLQKDFSGNELKHVSCH